MKTTKELKIWSLRMVLFTIFVPCKFTHLIFM